MAKSGPPGWRGGYGNVAKNSREHRILRFVQRKPPAASYKGETFEGEEITASSESRPIETVHVLARCMQIRALDKDGKELRMLDLTDPELMAELEIDEEKRSGGRNGVLSIDVPKLVNGIADAFVRVQQAASAQAAQQHEMTMGYLSRILDATVKRLEVLEAKLEAAQEAPTGSDDPGIAGIMAAMQQGAPLPPELAAMIQQFQTAKANGAKGAPPNGAR